MSNVKINQNNNFFIKNYLLFSTKGDCLINIKFTQNALLINDVYQKIFKDISLKLYTMYNDCSNFNFSIINFCLDKLVVLSHDDYISIGIFDSSSFNNYCKQILLHFYSARMNFMKYYTSIVRESIAILPFKIFEKFYLKYLDYNFRNIFTKIVYSSDILVPNIYFENAIIIDLSTNKTIFNLCKLERIHTKSIPKKIQKHLFHLAQKLKKDYVEENGYNFIKDISELNYYFIKFECTSSYPRYTFIIKFIPILKGVAIIHVYSQKKLSRGNNQDKNIGVSGKAKIQNEKENSNEDILEKTKKYRECDILNAQDFKGENDIEFKYSEPEKLKDLEIFLVDFNLQNKNYELNFQEEFKHNDYKCKYFNKDINDSIMAIANVQILNGETNVDKITQNISNLLLKMNIDEKNPEESNMNQDTSTMNSFSFLTQQNLQLTKDKILKIINSGDLLIPIIQKENERENNETLSLSEIEKCVTDNYEKKCNDWTKISIIKERPITPMKEASLVINVKRNSLLDILNNEESFVQVEKVKIKQRNIPVEKSYVRKVSQMDTARTMGNIQINNNKEKESSNLAPRLLSDNGNTLLNWNNRLIKLKNTDQKLALLDNNIDDYNVENDYDDDCESNHKFIFAPIKCIKLKK